MIQFRIISFFLIDKFNKFGILKEKKFLDKNDKNKLVFAEMKTENNLTQKSFIEKFLSSMRSKMYGKKQFSVQSQLITAMQQYQ